MPTFHELDRNRRKGQESSAGTGTGLGQAIGAIGSSTYVTNATKAVQESTYLASASDTIKRTVGVDIRAAIGGKSLAESAEERLKKDMEAQGSGGYRGSYQGIQIPTDTEPGSSSYSNPGTGYQPTQIKATSSKRWQADVEAQRRAEEKER